MIRSIVGLSCLAVILFALAGCVSPSDSPAKTVTLHMTNFSFDPGHGNTVVASELERMVAERLGARKNIKLVSIPTEADYVVVGKVTKLQKSRKSSRQQATVSAEMTAAYMLVARGREDPAYSNASTSKFEDSYSLDPMYAPKDDKISMQEAESEASRLLSIEIANAIVAFLSGKK
jgi:hypothetical protein